MEYKIHYKLVACPVCKSIIPQNGLRCHIRMKHKENYHLFNSTNAKEKARLLYQNI